MYKPQDVLCNEHYDAICNVPCGSLRNMQFYNILP